MHERQANESHESKDLQPVAVVVGYAEKSRVRVKRDHERKILRQRRAAEECGDLLAPQRITANVLSRLL